MMTLKEAIPLRTSRRDYNKEPLQKEAADALNARIQKINKEQGLHIQLILDGAEPFRGFLRSYGMFSGVQSYFALVGKTTDAHCNEKLGYFGEELVLAATALGLSTCWVGGSYKKGLAICELLPDEELKCVISVGYSAAEKSGKEKLIHNITHRKTKPLEALYQAEGAVPAWFLAGVRSVQLAPSAVNAQPVVVRYAKGAVTAFSTMDGHETDLGIAKLHFALGAGGGAWEWGQNGRWFKE